MKRHQHRRGSVSHLLPCAGAEEGGERLSPGQTSKARPPEGETMKEVEGEDRGGSLCSKFQGRRRRGSETKSKDGRTEGKAIKGHPAPRWPQSPLSEGRTDGMTVEWTMAAEYKIGHIFRRKGSRKGETNGCGEWPLWREEGLPPPPLVSGRESRHKGHNGIAP